MKKTKVLLRTAKKQARKKNQQYRAVVNVDNKTKNIKCREQSMLHKCHDITQIVILIVLLINAVPNKKK